MKPETTPGAKTQAPRKRVCMIAYTNYVRDGRVRLEAEALVSWGHEVVFLALREGPRPRNYELSGVTVNELNVQKYQGKSTARYLLSYLMFTLLAFIACSRLFLQSRIQVVHVHNMPNFLVFAGLLPRLLGGRLILDVHDTVPETYATKFGTNSRLLRGLLQLEERICCGLAHRIICVNHVQREAVVQRGIPAEKIATIISMPKFVSCNPDGNRRELGQAFRLVNHGTVSLRLGIDLIVRAVAELVREIPDFEFHLYGRGDDLEEITRLTESLGITEYVRFRGVVPWDELPKELAAMDAGIVANRRNVATELMLPLKLIDYVSLGIPAVVPRLRGIQYYFSEEMVSFFEPENIASMKEAILRLYLDKARRERQIQTAKAFLEKYGWENQQHSLLGVYQNL